MNHRVVLVLKAVNYGASKGSATQNTAPNPADLADGAIGIFGIHTVAGVNLNRLVLITDGGSETLGFIAAASFVGKDVFIAQGNAGRQPTRTNPIDLKTGLVQPVQAGKYVAPVRGVIVFGYNGTVGTSMNLSATINRGDDFTISLFNRNYAVAGFREPGQKILFSATINQGDSTYTILKNVVAKINLRTDTILTDKLKIRIRHNGTGAVFTNTATVAGVNGATTLTTSAAHGLTAGDLLSLEGDLYVSQVGTTGSTIVLDRPYQGSTHTIASVDTLDITVAPTAWGIEFTDDQDGRNIEGAISGIGQTATILRSTFPSPGNGSYQQVLDLEKEALPKKGSGDFTDATLPHEVYKVVAGTTYDMYFLKVHNAQHPNGDQGSVFRVDNFITLAFVAATADTTNFNQSDFEDAMTSLFTTFPQISA